MSKEEPISDKHQTLIDEICHYRALAIVLGAGERDMMNDYDRRLVRFYEKDKDTSHGEHWTATRDEVRTCWDEDDERVRAVHEQVAKVLEGEMAAQETVAELKGEDDLPGSAALHEMRASWCRWAAKRVRALGANEKA